MALLLVHKEYFTSPSENLVCLLERQTQVDEMSNESTQLIEYQVRVLLEFYLLLLFPSLNESFKALETFLEDVVVASSFHTKTEIASILTT